MRFIVRVARTRVARFSSAVIDHVGASAMAASSASTRATAAGIG